MWHMWMEGKTKVLVSSQVSGKINPVDIQSFFCCSIYWVNPGDLNGWVDCWVQGQKNRLIQYLSVVLCEDSQGCAIASVYALD